MDIDYPAAHSMDTNWFAVDCDGHVACFDSDEPGAVPAQLLQGTDTLDLLAELCRIGPPLEGIHDLEGWLVPGPAGSAEHHWMLAYPDRGDSFLVFLTSLAGAQPLVGAANAVPVRARQGAALVLHQPDRALIRTLHDENLCRGCCHWWESDFGVQAAVRHGVFGYVNPGYVDLNHNYWVPAPYGRQLVPHLPIHVDQLSPPFRQHLLRLRFTSLCFADTVHLQPVELTACEAWGDVAFLSGDGQRIVPNQPEPVEYPSVAERIQQHGLPRGLSLYRPARRYP